MKARCLSKNHKHYPHYGGRGIRVCTEWLTFQPFGAWASANRYADGLTLERKDVNGNYEPSNCTWITQREQCRNTRANNRVTAFGETKCVAAWVEDPRCVVTRYLLDPRLKRGWEPERAMTTPPLWRRDDLRKSP